MRGDPDHQQEHPPRHVQDYCHHLPRSRCRSRVRRAPSVGLQKARRRVLVSLLTTAWCLALFLLGSSPTRAIAKSPTSRSLLRSTTPATNTSSLVSSSRTRIFSAIAARRPTRRSRIHLTPLLASTRYVSSNHIKFLSSSHLLIFSPFPRLPRPFPSILPTLSRPPARLPPASEPGLHLFGSPAPLLAFSTPACSPPRIFPVLGFVLR